MSDDQQQTDAAPAVAPETPPGGALPIAPPGGSTSGDEQPADDGKPETFDREYVEELRRENAAARVRAKRADTLAAALATSYAELAGRLADSTDLPYSPDLCDEDGVPDEQKVRAAVDALLERKPHLASRRPVGDVGQGARPGEPDGVSLAGLLRAGAG